MRNYKVVACMAMLLVMFLANTVQARLLSADSAMTDVNSALRVEANCAAKADTVSAHSSNFDIGHEPVADQDLTQPRYHDSLLGRFVSKDPEPVSTEDGSNFNRYNYANNNPYRYTDPDGRDAVVTYKRDGSIGIAVPIKFSGPGATAANVSSIKSQIQSVWSGTYNIGGADVNVSVSVVDGATDGKLNNITLTTGLTSYTAAAGASFVSNGNSGEWNTNSAGMAAGEAAHEAGHLMGAADHYTSSKDATGTRVTSPADGFKGNLMGQLPGKPDSKNMSEILKSSEKNKVNNEMK